MLTHLKERGVNLSLYPSSIIITEDYIYFIIYNLLGQFEGYQRYNPLSLNKSTKDLPRYYTYYNKEKVNPVWGVETLNPLIKDLYIVEGVFKATKLHNLGFNSLCIFGNSINACKSFLNSLHYNLIAIGDNDKGGLNLIKEIGKGFQSPQDLDEMSDDDVLNLIKGFKSV